MNGNEMPRARRYGTTAFFVLAGVFITSMSCTKTDNAEGNDDTSHEPAYLLVQSSRGFEFDGDRLTIHGTSPTTIFFSDRPDRIAGHMPLETAYAWGRTGDDSFVVDPPNATLSILEEGEMANVVVTMSDAVIQGDAISFGVDILEGELPARGGPNTLFIDVIGRPLTPLSAAGVHRRTRRRSMAVGMAVGASAGSASANAAYQDAAYQSDSASQSAAAANDAAASANQAADAATQAAASAQNATGTAGSTGSESVEQELSELKDMLTKGLITQQDYDAKKKQLLGGM